VFLMRSSLALAVLVGCGSSCSGDDAHDAGHDGGIDGGVDAGSDAGPDARLDSGPSPQDAGWDARTDAGPNAAGWEPLPGLPSGCVIERAERPEVLMRSAWEPCGVGCEALAQEPGWTRAFYSESGGHDGERGYFVAVQSRDGASERVVVLGTTDGSPVAAWRGPPSEAPGVCAIGPVAVGATHAAFIVRLWGEWPAEDRIYHGPIAELGRVTEPLAVLDESWLPGGNATQNLAASATTVAAEVQPAGFVAVAEEGALARLGGSAGGVVGSPQNVQIRERAVYWEDWADRIRTARGSVSEGAAVWFEFSGADAAGTSIDSEWVAWQRGILGGGGTFADVEVWASPFAEDASDLTPTLITPLEGFHHHAMGAGIYVVRPANDRLDLYYLSDGRKRVFHTPPATGVYNAPLYVTADELLVPARNADGRTMLKVQISSLPFED